MGYVEKDYLMRYFNQLGVVIAKILGLKKSGKLEEAHQVIENSLTDFGLKKSEYYLSIDISDLVRELMESHGLNIDQIKILGELLFEKGEIEKEQGNLKISRHFYSRALVLFNYITEVEKVFSFEREEKIQKIKMILES
jgi:hypothetical protein